MRDALTNLFKMQPQNLIPEVNYLAAIVWLVVLICAFFSLKSQRIGLFAKVVWGLIIFCIPLVGLFAYCLFCLTKLEFTMLPAFTEWQQKMGQGSAKSLLKTVKATPPQKAPVPLDYPNITASRTPTKGAGRKE